MKTTRALNILLSLALAGMIGCSKESPTAPIPDNDDPVQLPTARSEASEEAGAMALWLGGELRSPDTLAYLLDSEITAIRNVYGDSIPGTAIEFRRPWQSGKIVVGFEDVAYDSVLNGQFTAWDSLNIAYGLDSVIVGVYHPSLAWAVLDFGEELNPVLLAQEYEQLPGVTFAMPNRYIGDGPMLLGWTDGEARVYFFRQAWENCLAGCLYSEYDIFRSEASEIEYLGHFGSTVNIPLDLRTLFNDAWQDYYR